MKEIFGLALVVILSLVGYRWIYTNTRRAKYISPIIFSEFLYILLGLLVGPTFLNFLDAGILKALTPLVFLGLGWIGILFGIQLKFKDIVKFPKSFLGITVLQSIVSAVLVFLALMLYLTLSGRTEFYPKGLITASLFVFASMAACTSQASLATVSREVKGSKNRNVINLMRYISSLDDMVAIPLVGIAFAYEGFHTIGGEIYFRWWDMLLSTVLLGLLSGFILNLIIRMTGDRRELLLVIIGMIILSVGGAGYLNVSPLLMTAISGMVLANLNPKRDEIMEILLLGEKPIFLIFLIIVGALLEFSGLVLIVVPIYIGMRLFGKVFGGFGSSLVFKTYFKIPRNIGLGLIPQGSMAVAIALCFYQAVPDPLGGLIVFSAAASVLFNEALAPGAIWFVLEDAQKDNRITAGTK
ncbi:MAG: cation:proton antiporter [Deltaproteobacteria bacterium]|uniref:Cation:proton antiporter n=1 Tax=Candidatus Zymogenus saltonus TaxID=2844893 RepID=A0A9D8KF39_9DELT|nr:cation:proton antiporter [Candidatus Zymogenus saltonus]